MCAKLWDKVFSKMSILIHRPGIIYTNPGIAQENLTSSIRHIKSGKLYQFERIDFLPAASLQHTLNIDFNCPIRRESSM